MGRLGCICGATMSNVDSPSRNMLEIYTAAEVDAAIKADRNITLWDFSILDRPYEYWYCTDCRRIHKVDNTIGRCILRYKPVGASIDQARIIGIPANWSELYVITDIELDAATEKEFNTKLIDYLPKIPRRVMLSPEQSNAIEYDAISGREIDRYEAEQVDE